MSIAKKFREFAPNNNDPRLAAVVKLIEAYPTHQLYLALAAEAVDQYAHRLEYCDSMELPQGGLGLQRALAPYRGVSLSYAKTVAGCGWRSPAATVAAGILRDRETVLAAMQ